MHFLRALLIILFCCRLGAAEALTVTFQTTAPGGQYQPKNILAVWVETQGGGFVRTIGDWSNTRRSNLVAWRAKAGTADTDAIMGATRVNHSGTLSISWDMNPRGSTTAVADGTYVVQFENVDKNGGSPNHRTSISFDKNGTASSGTIPSQNGYNNITWSYSGRSAAPAISSAATASGRVGTAFSYQITASNTPTSYSASGLPSGLSVNTTSGLISGTPTAAGISTVTLGATNASGTGTLSLTLTIANAVPVISSATTASGTVGTAFTYQITASGSPTSYTASGLPAGLSLNTTSGLISGTPTAAGTSTVSLGAVNSGGTGTASLTVTIANATPVISSSTTASGNVGTAFSYQITASGSPTSFGATGLPTGLSVNTISGLISGTPTAVGSSTVALSATNGTGTGTATLNLTINLAKPVITSSTTANATAGSAFSYQITASNAPTSFNASNLPAGLTVNTTTGLISGTPSVSGTFALGLTATNSGGNGTATLTLTIAGAAGTPAISSSGTANGTVGTAFSYQITATNSPTSFTATGLPAGLSINSASGLINGTPTTAGTSTVTITATNAAGSGGGNLVITIVNAVPVISSPLIAQGTVGAAFTYQMSASHGPTSYAAGGLPAGLTLNPATGLISGTPTVEGVSTIALGATNSGGTGTANLVLTIANVAPVISSPATANGTVGGAFSYQITASNNPTSYTASGLSAGLSLDTTSGLISGSPSASGTSSVSLGAINSGGTGTATLSLTIAPATVTVPVITVSDSVTGDTGSPFLLTVASSGSPTTYAAIGLPAGLTIDPATGIISGTPINVGDTLVTLSATNAAGTGTATIMISISDPPAALDLPGKCGTGSLYALVLLSLGLATWLGRLAPRSKQ